jgi:hypothetical protein
MKAWMVAAALGCAAAVVAAVPAEAAAQAQVRGLTDPRAWVESVYANQDPERQGDPAEQVHSDRLAALFALERREAGEEVGRLDFDYWTGSQDPNISSVRVTEEEVFQAPDRKVVIANFRNYDQAVTHHFYFERVGGRWFLDDVRHIGGGPEDGGWTLSIVLKYGN